MPPVSPTVAHALILATALLLYAFAWASVGSLPRAIRGVARIVLLLILLAPLGVFLLLGTQSSAPRQDTARAPLPEPPRPSANGTTQPGPGGGGAGSGSGTASDQATEERQRAVKQAEETARRAQEAEQQRSAEVKGRVFKMEVPSPVPPPVAKAPEVPPVQPKIASVPDQAPPSAPITSPSPPVAAAPAATTESTDWAVVPIFYGTDRKREEDPKRLKYGAARAGKLDIGRALVTVPKSHQVPNIERPWAVKVPFFDIKIYEQAEDPKSHFTIKEIASLPRGEFLSLVKARLDGAKKYDKQAVVFIHGYNTEFDYAVYRTAQMAYDLDFDGVPFLYSWPSGTGITGYVADRESAEQAEPYLREFIDMIVKESGAKSVSVIAHSMGNLPLLRTLRDMAPSLPEGVKFDQIVLAAPDVDRNVFEQLAHDLAKIGNGVTLYASSNDRAMEAARKVAGVARAGDVPPEGPVIIPGIDTIDITAVSTDAMALNHSTYAERSALINDIGLILRTRERPPEKRIPILEKVTIDRGQYWRYPK